jgi:hypothetical protein
MVIPVLAYGSAYIVSSGGLVVFNAWLMGMKRFPFAIAIVLSQNVVGSALAVFLLLVAPWMFTALHENKLVIDRKLLCSSVIPLSVLLSVQMVLNNTSYYFNSVAFIQMMKEGNLVLVYVISVSLGLEVLSVQHLQIISGMCLATVLTVKGETRFSFLGVGIGLTGQIFEAFRIVLQSIMLSSPKSKLDPMTYILLVSPTCCIVLTTMTTLLMWRGHFGLLPTPSTEEVVSNLPVLFPNGLVAFTLNLVVASFFRHSSAVGFILAGIVKDVVLVCMGVVVFKNPITALQLFGFFMQLFGVLMWSMLKINPVMFEDGLMSGLGSMFSMARRNIEVRRSYGSLDDSGGIKKSEKDVQAYGRLSNRVPKEDDGQKGEA